MCLDLDEHFLKTAERHLEECYECADRLMQGVRLLTEDDLVYKAPVGKRAMLMQRAHTKLQRQEVSGRR